MQTFEHFPYFGQNATSHDGKNEKKSVSVLVPQRCIVNVRKIKPANRRIIEYRRKIHQTRVTGNGQTKIAQFGV